MSKLRKEVVTGYDEFLMKLEEVRKSGVRKIWALFCGALNDSGESWCGDCTKALPIINKAIHQLTEKLKVSNDEEVCYIFVSIDRNTWKGSNSFRENLKLSAIPTVIYWEEITEKMRLVEGECSIPEKVHAVFQC